LTKLKAGTVARSVAKRFLHPAHFVRAVKAQRGRRKQPRWANDPQLALMAEILPGGFLHYGYFDDPDRPAAEISLAEFGRAQDRYAELLVALAEDRQAPVLDVGCGMGGLSRMLRDNGFSPTALTPDGYQAAHIAKAHPDIPVIHSKFENLPDPEKHENGYGTVFTSESLQYLKLPKALPLMSRILRSGGVWIACDMFRTGESRGKGGHNWSDFTSQLSEHGWEISYERDITAHVMPTLRLITMYGRNVGVPLMEFAVSKLRRKQPGLHYLLEDVLGMLTQVVNHNLTEVDPDDFVAHKKYVLLAMRRSA
jgi:SAM-dependent methyltransferase